MTDLMIHDSGRSGKISWATQVVQSGAASGMVISPWETPPSTAPRRPSATDITGQMRDIGAVTLFDPESHGVFVRGANRMAIYDEWDLWPSGGPAKNAASFSHHVDRVAEVQSSLGVPFIAPTICLEAPAGQDADLVIEVFGQMRSIAGDVGWTVAIVGTPSFWSAGSELDTFVGRIATLRPEGAILSVLRATGQYPWSDLTPEEVAGVCRTTQSLSRRMSVMLARSDLAGLPAAAAGASRIGTGWDLKQRVLSAELFRTSPGIRRQSQRVSHLGLFASLKRREAERLNAGNAVLSDRLVPGALPLDFNGHWRHHLSVLASLAQDSGTGATVGDRVTWLQDAYAAAVSDFGDVAGHVRPLEASETQWIVPLADGLRAFAHSEGL